MKKFTLAPEMEVTKLLNDQDIQEWQVEDTPLPTAAINEFRDGKQNVNKQNVATIVLFKIVYFVQTMKQTNKYLAACIICVPCMRNMNVRVT